MTWRSAATLVTAVSLTACGAGLGSDPASGSGPSPLTPDPGPAGTYQLFTIDGHALPHAPVDRDGSGDAAAGLEVVSATLVLDAGGTFHQTMAYRIERDGVVRSFERDFTGTWVRDGSGFLMTWDGAGRTPATLEGDSFVYDNVGMMLVFRRETRSGLAPASGSGRAGGLAATAGVLVASLAFASANLSAPQASYTPRSGLAAAGALGAVGGLALGFVPGALMGAGGTPIVDCADCDAGLQAGLVGGYIGMALLTPLAVHLRNDRRGSLGPAWGRSGLIAGAGLSLMFVGIATEWGTEALSAPALSWVSLVVTPAALVLSAVQTERSTADRRLAGAP
jgi:hypothetical protein